VVVVKTKVLLAKADKDPVKGVEDPKPNQIYKNVRISVAERELGALEPDQIRVEMLYVSICGTDVHLATVNPETGYIRTSAPLEIPNEGRVIGHEGVGRVLRVGSNVKQIEPGMYVTFESIIVCNICDVCRRGNFNQCRDAKLLGLEQDGLMGEVVDVPAKLAHNITDYVKNERDLIALACLEPAAVAYVACQNARVQGGDIIVIFGGGPIGILAAMLVKWVFGAAEVHLVEPVEFRRKFAAQWADQVYPDVESLRETITIINGVIEASGDLNNVTGIFNRIDANGQVVLLARSGAPLSLTNVDHLITNQIEVKGSRGHLCGAFNSILNLYRAGRIDMGSIVTLVGHGLDELKTGLENSAVLIEANCKVVVELGSTGTVPLLPNKKLEWDPNTKED
jgi:threonine dehydrogenase-like Zn-dependent dehydrogenase